MPSAAEIILFWICPVVGIFFTNSMFLAPLKDLQTAVNNGQGLNGLNPTPWAFMLGICLGWTAYAIMTKDWFLFFADGPGTLVSVWLNMGAIKLLYSAHYQKQTRNQLVTYLAKNDKERAEQTKAALRAQEERMMPVEEDGDEEEDDDEVDAPGDDKVDDNANTETAIPVDHQGERKSVTFDKLLVTSSAADQGQNSMTTTAVFDKSMTTSEVFQASTTTATASSSNSNVSSWRKPALTKMQASMANMASSFAQRKQKWNEWGEIVWSVTSQQTPAKASHEKMIMGMISLWFVTLSALGFYSHYVPTEEGGTNIPQRVVGIMVNIVQVFFYGAPLGRIRTVLQTKKCDIIHFNSLIANTLDASLWFCYGLAPQVRDPIIWIPCGLGLLFSVIQFALCAIFPRSKEVEERQKKFSLTTMISARILTDLGASSSPLVKHHNSGLESIRETDVEANEEDEDAGEVEYATSLGNYSFLF